MHKWYGEFHVLKGITTSIQKGEVVVVCGPSGSGKSTFIRTINRLEEHQRGRIVVDGIELTGDLRNIDAIRREVGMVFQQFNLFPHLTVLQNVTLGPVWVKKVKRDEAKAKALELLDRVGIAEQADKYPGQLSGGQQQRVAIARAIVNRPVLLLADEPTGALDSQTTQEVMDIFGELNANGMTVVMVTHEASVAKLTQRIVWFRDGCVINAHLHPEALAEQAVR